MQSRGGSTPPLRTKFEAAVSGCRCLAMPLSQRRCATAPAILSWLTTDPPSCAPAQRIAFGRICLHSRPENPAPLRSMRTAGCRVHEWLPDRGRLRRWAVVPFFRANAWGSRRSHCFSAKMVITASCLAWRSRLRPGSRDSVSVMNSRMTSSSSRLSTSARATWESVGRPS